MIKFENTEVMGWEAAIRGMRNPMNSWKRVIVNSMFNAAFAVAMITIVMIVLC